MMSKSLITREPPYNVALIFAYASHIADTRITTSSIVLYLPKKFRDAVGKMTDKAADEKIETKMRKIIISRESVIGIDLLHTRLFGDKIYVDVEISVDGTKALNEAHDIAQRVHDVIESEFPKVKHCTVHINPAVSNRVRKRSHSKPNRN